MNQRDLITMDDLHLFTGVSQLEHFGRMNELVATRAMPASSRPRDWEMGEPASLPASFRFEGRDCSVAQFLDETETVALLVLQDGRIRYESYARTGGADVPWISMSVAKSFVSALVGIALAEGSIRDIEDPISDYVPVEPGSAYDGVAIRSVLQMSSGARWNEDYSDPDADALRLAAATSGHRGDHDSVVATMVRESEPDTVCRYNSCDTQALAALVRHATGGSLADFMQRTLCEPLGFGAPGYWIVDPHGVEMGYAGLNLVARDFARIGEVYRRGGDWHGVQVVPAQWVADSIVAKGPHTQPGQVVVGDEITPEGYGYQWWLPVSDRGQYMAAGVYNQYVFVDPVSRVTVVKLSANHLYGTATDESAHHEQQHTALLQALTTSLD